MHSIFYSDDYFEGSKLLLDGGNKFAITEYYIYAARIENEKTKEVGLYVSLATHYDFKKVKLPFDLLREHLYTVVESRSRHVIIHVSHSVGELTYGHLYMTDSTGARFELSLRNNIRNAFGYCDFSKVQGLDGVYIANVYEQDSLSVAKVSLQHAQTQEEKLDILKHTLKRKTLITYDRGLTWSSLHSGSKPCNNENCTLHLHALSSPSVHPIAASASAPGFALANGNLGSNLNASADTFMSDNGGVDWKQIANGSSFFEIGDQGGLLIRAADGTETDEIQFSWDLGYHWKKVRIGSVGDKVFIKGLKADPMKLGVRIIVYGIMNTPNKTGFVNIIDFSELMKTPCNTEDDFDYEEWSPEFPNGECTFGKRMGYLRRKPYVLCYNPDYLQIARVKGYCSCTRADWECADTHIRSANGTCEPISGKQELKEPPEDCHTYYRVPSGYRKVPESECERGLDLSGEVYACPQRRKIK